MKPWYPMVGLPGGTSWTAHYRPVGLEVHSTSRFEAEGKGTTSQCAIFTSLWISAVFLQRVPGLILFCQTPNVFLEYFWIWGRWLPKIGPEREERGQAFLCSRWITNGRFYGEWVIREVRGPTVNVQLRPAALTTIKHRIYAKKSWDETPKSQFFNRNIIFQTFVLASILLFGVWLRHWSNAGSGQTSVGSVSVYPGIGLQKGGTLLGRGDSAAVIFVPLQFFIDSVLY